MFLSIQDSLEAWYLFLIQKWLISNISKPVETRHEQVSDTKNETIKNWPVWNPNVLSILAILLNVSWDRSTQNGLCQIEVLL